MKERGVGLDNLHPHQRATVDREILLQKEFRKKKENDGNLDKNQPLSSTVSCLASAVIIFLSMPHIFIVLEFCHNDYWLRQGERKEVRAGHSSLQEGKSRQAARPALRRGTVIRVT